MQSHDLYKMFTASSLTFFILPNLHPTSSLTLPNICSDVSVFWAYIRQFFSLHMLYIKALQAIFNKFEIKAFPFSLFTVHSSSGSQVNTFLFNPRISNTFIHSSLVKEHPKNKWSLVSCSLQNAQLPSMAIPHAFNLSLVGNLFRIADQEIKACFGTLKVDHTNLSQVTFPFLSLITLYTFVALYFSPVIFHLSFSFFSSTNSPANGLSFINFLQLQLLFWDTECCHMILPFKT